jgi:MFS transporter, DHA1 family, multidrug/chloramphenicol efflux transport protein
MTKILINISQRQAFAYATFLVLYEFLTYIANDMIMPGMIKVVESFNGPETAIATSLTAYVLGGASLQLFLGPISDRYGRRPVMLFGALLFFVFTIFIALTSSIEQFLVARYFQGMGLCFIVVIGYATLQEIFTEMDAIRLIAVMANVSITAPLLGPLVGAVFVYYYSWRIIFLVIGVLALVVLWGLWRYMPEPVGQTKINGEQIKRSSLSFKTVGANYKNLLLNRSFMLGSIALGTIYMPCLAWIALSPVMLVKKAHLTLIQYGFWQLPVFGAYILGNLVLHRLTHHCTVKTMIVIASTTAGSGLLITYLLPLLVNDNFLWLMPGLIIYFFGSGIIMAPLSRFILFSTPVSKGTASALMGMISMAIQGSGIEIVNYLYASHDNMLFSLYCALAGIAFSIILTACLWKTEAPNELD